MTNGPINSALYEYMIKTERKALKVQDLFLNRIKDYIQTFISEDAADYTRIILAEGGYIKIRTVEEVNQKDIEDFYEEFNFSLCWEAVEEMIDYRNVETVSSTIYEYSFIPKDINKILGDNQVDLNVNSD